VALRASGSSGGGYAFFDQEFSKIVAPPAALKALMKFSQASNCQSMVGLSDLCEYAQDGTRSEESQPGDGNFEFPYDIRFEGASSSVFLPDKKMTDEEMLSYLADIKEGTTLFNVFTKESPMAEKVKIGSLTTASECVKSTFGDEKLFFRHQRMEEDFARRPEWIKDVHADGCVPVAGTYGRNLQCPGIQNYGTHYGKAPCRMDEKKIVMNHTFEGKVVVDAEYCGRPCNVTSDCPTEYPPGTQSFPPHAVVEASCGLSYFPTVPPNICVLYCYHEDEAFTARKPQCPTGSECLYLGGDNFGKEAGGICVHTKQD